MVPQSRTRRASGYDSGILGNNRGTSTFGSGIDCEACLLFQKYSESDCLRLFLEGPKRPQVYVNVVGYVDSMASTCAKSFYTIGCPHVRAFCGDVIFYRQASPDIKI